VKILHFSQVKIGAIQNKIVLPTTAPVSDQRNALHARIAEIAEIAGKCGVNILCLQEAWRKLKKLETNL